MKSEGPFPCSQDPSTGPYPEPDQSIPSHPISLRSILILSTQLCLGLHSGLFVSGFQTNILHAFLFSPIRATEECLQIKIEGFPYTQSHFLLLHSQHASAQIGYHQVIREEYTNDDGIHIKLQC
jgi:hypothetical protein